MTVIDSSRSNPPLCKALLAQAARNGSDLLAHVLAVTRQSIRKDVQRMGNMLERDHLELSVKLLDTHASRMCERFPILLAQAFRRNGVTETKLGLLSGKSLHLDQLELMDEAQVHERVELARALQHVSLAAEASLTGLNTYVCALLELDRVMPERNPLRPDSYVSSLQSLMTEMAVPSVVRMIWLQHLAGPLGNALSAAYLEWSGQLAGQGVQPAGFLLLRTPDPAAVPQKDSERRSDREVWSPQYRQTVLTLDHLRRLMAGELDAPPANPKDAFARQFTREFEVNARTPGSQTADSQFQSTVPAALDALQEMQQVDEVLQRMKQRPFAQIGRTDSGASRLSVREELIRQAKSMSQTLSLEVVALMIDNLVQDTRLLSPVRRVIDQLEPALLRLVLIDPRFFIDRQHPARRLLQEISQQGLAFRSVDDQDFGAFLLSLQRHVSPLAAMQIDSAEPFEAALSSLLRLWNDARSQEATASQIDNAVAALGFAEDRNLLAGRLVVGLQAMPEIRRVPPDVVEFLCGPWPQVMAGAQLNDRTGADDPGQYKDLVNDLLWSAQPELTRKDISRLTKLVPRLLFKLREGLHLIDYPSVKTSAFFDVLMKLHQLAFRPMAKAALPIEREGLAATLLSSQDHWVAPAEAKASGFMAFPDDVIRHAPSSGAAAASAGSVAPQPELLPVEMEPQSAQLAQSLSVGAWIELQVKGSWQRTQLSWISPQSTMYLFTSGQGKTQSMTLRMLERLLAEDTLRVVSDHSMVDGALDAVVHTAMLNSIDIKI